MTDLFDSLAHLLRREAPQPAGDPAAAPVLLVGLGNPGREYRDTRHNVGFMAVDRAAEAIGARFGKVQNKALLATGQWEGQRVVLAKPQTFMNLSGQAVAPLVRFYKLPLERVLVLHDDLDLPLGTLRLRPGGGSGGQKGLASIIERLGTREFPRLRIGIGRPPGRMNPADYVLEKFLSAEQATVQTVLDRAVEACRLFVAQGIEPAMNQYNGRVE